MAKQLHITNGDATGEMLKEIFAADEILCWRDVLHDGPLTLAPRQVHNHRRARFMADTLLALGDTTLEEDPYPRILADVEGRDALMSDLGGFEAITLWFEHDLYDQLQIAEILHRLAAAGQRTPNLALVCIDGHPEVPYFHGLGNLNPAQLADLYPQRQQLGHAQLATGQRIWRGLCATDPLVLSALLQKTFNGLPFMAAALWRFCEEFPALSSGLTRTQTLLLQAVGEPLTDLPLLRHHLRQQEKNGRLPGGETAKSRYHQVMAGPMRFERIFLSLQTLETAPFMGDLWVQKELAALSRAPTPYLSVSPDQEAPHLGHKAAYAITAAGQTALTGSLHWAEVNTYDLWRGGVHLSPAHLWYWDAKTGSFTQAPLSADG